MHYRKIKNFRRCAAPAFHGCDHPVLGPGLPKVSVGERGRAGGPGRGISPGALSSVPGHELAGPGPADFREELSGPAVWPGRRIAEGRTAPGAGGGCRTDTHSGVAANWASRGRGSAHVQESGEFHFITFKWSGRSPAQPGGARKLTVCSGRCAAAAAAAGKGEGALRGGMTPSSFPRDGQNPGSTPGCHV